MGGCPIAREDLLKPFNARGEFQPTNSDAKRIAYTLTSRLICSETISGCGAAGIPPLPGHDVLVLFLKRSFKTP